MTDTSIFVPRRTRTERQIERARGKRDWRKEYGL